MEIPFIGYDLATVISAATQGSPIVLVVLGLVTWLGQAGIKGKAQFFAGFALGAALGVGYMIAELGQPVDFAGYFYLALYGLVVGMTPSGIYETGKRIAIRAYAETLGHPPLGSG